MAKRDNGTGTIYQRTNGSWVGKIYLGRDEAGKEKFKYLSGKTEGEVKRKIREYNQSGAPVEVEKISLGDYLRNWLRSQAGTHSLRHTFASVLFANGTDVKTVSELLGHASIQITLNTYIHLIGKPKHGAVAKLDDAF